MSGPFGVPWWLLGCACLVVAGVFTVVWPHPRAETSRWRMVVLRWAHPAVWLLLAAPRLLRAAPQTHGDPLPTVTAQSAAPMYVLFLGTAVLERRLRSTPR